MTFIVHRSMMNDLKVADKLYILRLLLALEDFLVFSLYSFNKKHFRLGGMAPSEWTRSVRAVRDTPVADYSTPGVNARSHVAYCPLNAVSPFVLTLSVS